MSNEMNNEINLDALKASVAELAGGASAPEKKVKATTKSVKAKEPKEKVAKDSSVKAKASSAKAASVEMPEVVTEVASLLVELPAPPAPPVVSVPPVVSAVNAPVVVTPVAVASVTLDVPVYPDVVPAIVADLLNTGMAETKIVKTLTSQNQEHPEIHEWASVEIKAGRPKASLVAYFAVKRGVRTALGIDKPAPKKPTNLSTAAELASKLSVPSNSQPQTVANDSPTSILQALKPGKTPLRKFTNEKSGRTFLLWSDYLAAKSGQYSLRFRKFTVGENSKPGKGTPSVYLLKGESATEPGVVVAKMSSREFIVMLDFLNKLGTSGALSQIFQALVEMEKE